MAVDNYYSNVKLLLHCDGVDTSTTFTDNSSTPKTVTANGNAQIDTAQSQWGGASGVFDGTGDYLSTAYVSADFDWWTQDCTLELWVRPADLSTFTYIDSISKPALIGHMNATNTSNYWSFGPQTDGTVRFCYYNGSSQSVTSTATVTINNWHHLALVKSSSGIQIYVNGVGLASPVAVSGTPQSNSSLASFIIGQANNRSINGWVDDIRFTKGVARYTANFTPPTEAFPDSGPVGINFSIFNVSKQKNDIYSSVLPINFLYF